MGCSHRSIDLWPNGVIPYAVSPELEASRDGIDWAAGGWSRDTAVTFIERTDQADYVEFQPGGLDDVCRSTNIGRSGGRQIVKCSLDTNLQHEMGHVVGLLHEQTRSDRDQHITFHEQNVQRGLQSQYTKVLDSLNIGEYDYDSIMHYPQSAGAVQWHSARQISGQKSRDTPALAEFGGELHMAYVGDTSTHIWHTHSTDGTTWTQPKAISDQSTKTGVALCAFNDELHMVHLGEESNQLFHTWSSDGRSWSTNQSIESHKSRATPALAAGNGRLHMAHVGDTSNKMYHAWTTDGRDWTSDREIDHHRSSVTPTIFFNGGNFNFYHLGETSRIIYLSYQYGKDWGLEPPSPLRPMQISRSTVALAREGSVGEHLVYLGASSEPLHMYFYVEGWKGGYSDMNESTHTGVALAVLNNQMWAIFLGVESHSLYQALYDHDIVAFDVPDGVHPGSGVLSAGDIAAVASLY